MLNKKINFILICFIFISIQLISASNIECIVKSSDTVLSNSPRNVWTESMFEEEQRANAKQGYIITCKDAGLGWGRREADPAHGVIVSFPEEEYNSSWLEPEYNYSNPSYCGFPTIQECIDEYILECDGDQGCIDYFIDMCNNYCLEYPILTEKKYRLPLESFLTRNQINYIRNIDCINETLRTPIITNLTNVSELIIYNNWTTQPYDWIRPGDPSCDYYASLGDWYVSEDNKTLVTYPRYARDRTKFIILDARVSLTSANTTLNIFNETKIVAYNITWDGNLTLPVQLENASAIPENPLNLTVIGVGFSNAKLLINKPAQLILKNQAGSLVGYTRRGDTFHEINETCAENSLDWATNNLGRDDECKINVGRNLVIWTTHFTEFMTYNLDSDNDGVIDSEDLCENTILPEEVPLRRLLMFRFANIDEDRIFETRNRRRNIIDSIFSIKDTHGCSCEQILDFRERPSFLERWFGCSRFTINNFIGEINE